MGSSTASGDDLRILLVEDSPDDAELVELTLRRAGLAPHIERVWSARDFLAALARGGWQVVISDYDLPGFSGLAALRLMRERGIDLPFIIVSGTIGEETAVEVMRCGANDYLIKGNLTRLVPSVLREVESANARLHRRLAEEALQLRDFAVNQAPDPMFTVDRDLGLLTVNDTACRRLGWSREALGRLRLSDLDADGTPAPWLAALEDARRAGRTTLVRPVRTNGGEAFPAEVSLSYFSYDGRDLWCCFLRDIAERRRAEADLRRATTRAEQAQAVAEDANRAKSEFLANMSHELRTPLTAVLGMAELLVEEVGDPGQREQADAIRTSGTMLLSIINDLLDLSKIEAGQIDLEALPCDLSVIASELLVMVRPRIDAKRLDLRLEIAPGTRLMRLADPVRLRQVLLNLVGNAVKFTDAGHVRLVISGTEHVRFTVHDTGIGIAPEQQARLFTPFTQADTSTTRRFGGTGLGLAIVKRLAQRMSGTVGMASELGVGSAFWVELPLPAI